MNFRTLIVPALVLAFFIAPYSTQASFLSSNLTLGSKGPEVTALQTTLKSLGLFNEEISGYFGPVTLNSLKTFQKNASLSQSGAIDSDTHSALNSYQGFNDASTASRVRGAYTTQFTRTLRVGSRGDDVTLLQTFLLQNSYMSASPSGYFGQLTKAGVKAFQIANGLEPVGFVGPATRAKLNAILSGGTTTTETHPTDPVISTHPDAPTLSFNSDTSSVVSGGTVLISWSSTGATSCTASGEWSGSRAVSGSTRSGAITSAQTYILMCSGAGGSVSRSFTVSPVIAPTPDTSPVPTPVPVTHGPTVTLTAAASSVLSGQAVRLSWVSTNATSCTASGGWSGTKSTQESTLVYPTSATTYTLVCSGTGGTASHSVTVAITAPVITPTPTPTPATAAPTVTFTANPSSITSGQNAVLSWTSTNTTSCIASGHGWTTNQATSGSATVTNLTANQTYTLICTGVGGSTTKTVTVSVSTTPAPTPTPVPTPTPTPAPITSGGTGATAADTSRLTARGIVLPSAGGGSQMSTSAGNMTLQGSAGNETLYNLFAPGATLIGGAGDDVYVTSWAVDTITELSNGGIDGIIYYGDGPPLRLPANVENLSANGGILVGNGLNNYIAGGNNRDNVIDGGAGDDVLVGGTTKNTFIVTAGNGNDAIVGFKTGTGGDVVNLRGYNGMTTYTAIRSRMSVLGNDTSIDLGNGEILVIRNVSPSQFVVTNFFVPLDLASFNLAFDDEFNSFSRCVATDRYTNSCAGGVWRTNYKGTWAGAYADMAGRNLNGEEEIYMDPEFPGVDQNGTLRTTALGVNPFQIVNGSLRITAKAESAATQAAMWNHKYSSGAITTRGTYTQTNGYFEMSAKMPKGQGIWPAFWLLSADGLWPPEIDAIEMVTDPTLYYASLLTTSATPSGCNVCQAKVPTPDLSQGFHRFGVDIENDRIKYYFDGEQVGDQPTPADMMNRPMYMLANLAIGGSWPGTANPAVLPANMDIEYIRTYTHTPGQQVITPASIVAANPNF